MKARFCPTILAVSIATTSLVTIASAGETLKTKRGKEYRGCEVIGKDAYGVTFRHEGGMARVGYADLPEAAQRRFEYDPVEAKRFVDVRRPKPAPPKPVLRPTTLVSNRVLEGALASRPRGRHVRNPYALTGSLHNPAAYGASFGGFVQPYYAGSFGTPRLVTSIPGGFFTPTTLRLGARPILESPVAPAVGSYSQYRDARASAVRAAVRATRPVVIPRPVVAPRPAGGHHRGRR